MNTQPSEKKQTDSPTIRMIEYTCRDCGCKVSVQFGLLPEGWQITTESEWICWLCNTHR